MRSCSMRRTNRERGQWPTHRRRESHANRSEAGSTASNGDGGGGVSKPLGIGLAITDGALTFRVSPIDRVADCIWDAVREAITANMTPEQFRAEVVEAWEHHLREDAAYARDVFKR